VSIRFDFRNLNHLFLQVLILAFVAVTSIYPQLAVASKFTQQELAPLVEVEEPNFVMEKEKINENISILEETKTENIQISKESSTNLCSGVVEAWKLVPVPSEEGQFIICNTENLQETATGGELDIALNNYRSGHGLNTLSIDSTLCVVASQRADEIKDDFSHDGFDGAVERNNISYSSIGENIASGPLSATKFVEWSWDQSPGHRENMLRDWTRGCGAVSDGYAVYIFAK